MNLSHEEARKICLKHGHMAVAQEIVDALPNRSNLTPMEVAQLIEEQISSFARSLINCIETAYEGADKVKGLPTRAKRGKALRKIRKALEQLRVVLEGNWELAQPLLELDVAMQLGEFLTTEAVKKLLPPRLTANYIRNFKESDEYGQQQIARGYLLDAGSRPLTRLIKVAKIGVRHAEKKVRSGAPIKDPLSLALVLQLASHYEWQLRMKAAWSADGPFSRFCVEVFAAIGCPTTDSWEHLLRAGLKYHRSSFISRRLHEQQGQQKSDFTWSEKRKPRKRKLTPSSRTKTKPKQ